MKLELPCLLLLPSLFPEAARRLGIAVDDVDRITWESAAYRDGKVFDLMAFEEAFPSDAFEDFTGDKCFPAELLASSFEVPRDPTAMLTPPISEHDRFAADAWVALRRYRRLRELRAPSILLANELSNLRRACDFSTTNGTPWQPAHELMTGSGVEPGAAGEAHAMFAVPFYPIDPTLAVDAAWLGEGLVVFWPYAAVVFELDGTIRDVFPTRGLRAVGGDDRYAAFVCGGGGAANSGYFGAQVFVRDTRARAWLPQGTPIPETLPRFVAGTIGDVKWAVVIDTREGLGYRTSPRASGDQCGETFNSACGRYVWDRGRFVLEAATGEAVLDAEPLEGKLVGFAKTETGWRFLMQDDPEDNDEEDGDAPRARLHLKDETNAVVRTLDANTLACALSARDARLVEVSSGAIRISEADSGRAEVAFDLSELRGALELPDREDELWQQLAATFGTAAQLAACNVEQVRQALAGLWRSGELADADLRQAIAAANTVAPLPERVPSIS